MSTVLAILKIVADLVLAWLGRSSQQPTTPREEKDRELQQTFNKIDSGKPDFDGAISRLRERSGKSTGSANNSKNPT